MLDFGTDVFRGTFLYDLLENEFKPWNEGRYGDALWSPDGNTLAYGVPEIVQPETPVGAGYSVTTAVRRVNDGHRLQTVIQGTSDFETSPLQWKDKNTLIIRKSYYEGFRVEFFEANIQSGEIREISEQEASNNNPPYSARLISPDGRYRLDTSDGKIHLRLLENDSVIELFTGDMPRWYPFR